MFSMRLHTGYWFVVSTKPTWESQRNRKSLTFVGLKPRTFCFGSRLLTREAHTPKAPLRRHALSKLHSLSTPSRSHGLATSSVRQCFTDPSQVGGAAQSCWMRPHVLPISTHMGSLGPELCLINDLHGHRYCTLFLLYNWITYYMHFSSLERW
jgi:hypothetical protein